MLYIRHFTSLKATHFDGSESFIWTPDILIIMFLCDSMIFPWLFMIFELVASWESDLQERDTLHLFSSVTLGDSHSFEDQWGHTVF